MRLNDTTYSQPTACGPDGGDAQRDAPADWEPCSIIVTSEEDAEILWNDMRKHHPLFEFRIVGPRYYIERRRK